MTPFDSLADESRWVGWRNELRGGKPTKVPKGTNCRNAKSDDPSTWGTRAEAEAWAAQLVNGQGGGIGIQLGDLGGDTYLVGIDLDSCISDDGNFAGWTQQILGALPTYTEVSPSGRGLKAFFYCATEDVRPFLKLVGVRDSNQWGFNRSIPGQRSKADHGPGVELYFSGRFFTVTGKQWPSQPDKVASLDWPMLERLAALIPPAGSKNAGSGKRGSGGSDNSRSGAAFRKGAALRRAGNTFEQMVEALRTDPETADWVREKGQIDRGRELRRIWERASTQGTQGAKTIVKVVGGELPRVVDEAEALLVASDLDLYEFGDQVVRPAVEPIKIADKKKVLGLRLVPVGANHLTERFMRVIDFQRFDMRSNKWASIDCPSKVAATYLERIGLWQLPKLTALTTCPVLRPDGTVLDQPGFDEATGILFDPRGVEFPLVPPHPTRDQGRAALAELKLPFSEFPFVDDASRSVLWSGLLCTVSRLAFPFAPLHAFDAPAAGTGKSKLVNCCSILGNGYEASVVSQGDDETELEKRLGALLLAGDRFISIDNCDAPLGGQLLCQIITQGLIKVRVLGLSKMVTIPNNTLLFATGNNFKLIGDMLRRGLIGRLDAEVERPEMREFSFEDPEITLERERAKYVVHALTVLRAYIVAGRPMAVQPLGGFEEWSLLVRDALLWLGEVDPVTTIERARAEDPGRQSLEAILVQWNEILGARRVSAKQVIEAALAVVQTQDTDSRNSLAYPEFRAALLTVAGDHDRIVSRRLGHWLSTNKGTVVNNRRIVADGILDGIARWRMQCWTNGKWV